MFDDVELITLRFYNVCVVFPIFRLLEKVCLIASIAYLIVEWCTIWNCSVGWLDIKCFALFSIFHIVWMQPTLIMFEFDIIIVDVVLHVALLWKKNWSSVMLFTSTCTSKCLSMIG